MNERELLERLIKEKLGEGKATFEVNIGSGEKRIDMVFEKKDEIWLVEAKKSLNFEALGQILTYGKLYSYKVISSKNIKLGIVCKQTDLEIEQVCKDKGAQVFVFPQIRVRESKTEEAPVCAICGNKMIKEKEEFKCKTCECLFGRSSIVEECYRCKAKFGAYQAVEKSILDVLGGSSFRRNYWMSGLCPKCRRKEMEKTIYGPYGTIAELIKLSLANKEARITPYQLKIQAGLPEEFIDYCLERLRLSFN